MPLHVVTPLLPSTEFSSRFGLEVDLKLDAVQPAGSFKIRGVGHACEVHYAAGARRFVSSSGGNAGYAVAYAGRQLGVPVTVVVPLTTSQHARTLIAALGADVIVHGDSWVEANEQAQALLDAQTVFIHPFDDPLLWQGHATLVTELAQQGAKPDAIVCSVGGGGLLNGILQGLDAVGWQDVAVLAVETHGAASLQASIRAGKQVSLPAITSIATSLGAKAVSAQTLALLPSHRVISCVVSDREAVQGSMDLLQAHRILSEPACGASVAALAQVSRWLPGARRVVVVACGGIGTTLAQLQQWQASLV